MGPRHFSRGSHTAGFGTASQRLRFNGATAFQPWKCWRAILMRTGQAASMGPRHFSRGSLFRVRWQPIRLVQLQWGHGISAVEVEIPGYSVSWKNVLQWGHGISAVEVGQGTYQPRRGIFASMGPRHFSRGSLDEDAPFERILLASMGPRHFSRGSRRQGHAQQGEYSASMGPRHFSRGS